MTGPVAGFVDLGARHEGLLRGKHPWIYRDRLPRWHVEHGSWVKVQAGGLVRTALFDAEGAIALRRFASQGVPDVAWFRQVVTRAVEGRSDLARSDSNTYRLIYGESDGLPGIVADRYGRFVAVQAHASSVEPLLPIVAKEIVRATGLSGVVVRRGQELEVLAGSAPPPEITVREHGLSFLANLVHGQKTGLFLDHREHRASVRSMASGLRVANLFSYAGGFDVYALAGGAREVWSVDRAAPALHDARRNVRANGLDPARHRTFEADVFEILGTWAKAGERFDLVILDPPSLTRNRAGRARALAAYRALNASAARLVRYGGHLLTASCTAQIDAASFDGAVRDGLKEAGVRGVLAWRGGQPSDHPVRRWFPEGRYLDVACVRIERSERSERSERVTRRPRS